MEAVAIMGSFKSILVIIKQGWQPKIPIVELINKEISYHDGNIDLPTSNKMRMGTECFIYKNETYYHDGNLICILVIIKQGWEQKIPILEYIRMRVITVTGILIYILVIIKQGCTVKTKVLKQPKKLGSFICNSGNPL